MLLYLLLHRSAAVSFLSYLLNSVFVILTFLQLHFAFFVVVFSILLSSIMVVYFVYHSVLVHTMFPRSVEPPSKSL